MSVYRKLGIEGIILASCLLLGAAVPAKVMFQQDNQQTAPDNSKVNQNQNPPTADQQKMNPADRDLTKKIRMAIHEDKALSMYAHNIKIISQDGKVTLRGPVRSDDEKAAIEAKAVAVAGDGNVTNHLHVAPPKS